MSFKKMNRLKMAAFLLASCVSAVAFAQTASDIPGIVRISDGRLGANARSSGGVQQASACENGVPCQNGSAGAGAGTGGGACPPGGGMDGVCPTGGACQYGQCRHCLLGCCREHYCKHSPDYGYSPPAKYPLHRRGVEYTTYYPNQWYGAGADYSQVHYPMVYAPTDTTQMGFYYQHVPFWQPAPNRLPERPIPAQWNIVAPPVSAAQTCGQYCYPGSPFYYGNRCRYRAYQHWGIGHRSYDVTDWSTVNGSTSNGQVSPQAGPAIQPPAGGPGVPPTPVQNPTPSPLPEGEEDDDADETPGNSPSALQRVPARPDSASSGHIRRLGYNN